MIYSIFNFKGNSPPISPQLLLENNQPMEIVELSTNVATDISRQEMPALHEIISDFNGADAMVIIGEKELFLLISIKAYFSRV